MTMSQMVGEVFFDDEPRVREVGQVNGYASDFGQRIGITEK